MLDGIHEFFDLVPMTDLEAARRQFEAHSALAESDEILDRLHSGFSDIPLHGGETNLDSLQKCLSKSLPGPLGTPTVTDPACGDGMTLRTVMLAKKGTASYEAELSLRQGLDDFIRRLRGHYGLG